MHRSFTAFAADCRIALLLARALTTVLTRLLIRPFTAALTVTMTILLTQVLTAALNQNQPVCWTGCQMYIQNEFCRHS
ncbi:MAG: hypothetical protein JWM30_3840 [Burkholderia sp.]|nr:hypothetical protein [Burkholderia sp.]